MVRNTATIKYLPAFRIHFKSRIWVYLMKMPEAKHYKPRMPPVPGFGEIWRRYSGE